MSQTTKSPIAALNFHVWQPCNMGCRYCFAEFGDAVSRLREDKLLLQQRAEAVVKAAAAAGIEKLTFVGGEPTLCPWLLDLLQLAKRLGMVTMLVSNGSRMTDRWVEKHAPWLDWAALSIDSLDPKTNLLIGRKAPGRFSAGRRSYSQILGMLKEAGCRLKVNTVVSSLNWQEEFTDFLMDHAVERWKVLQVLHVHGENDAAFPELSVCDAHFTSFVQRHRGLRHHLVMAVESNAAMRGSYLMVDPLGRFFSNTGGGHHYSEPIWAVGWQAALAQVDVSAQRFVGRGGQYDWGYVALPSS